MFSFFTPNSGQAEGGEELFKTYCGSCHMLSSQDATGPGLAGITDKRSAEWLKSWISNSTEFIATGDEDAIAIFEEYNKVPMPPFAQLSDGDLDNLIAYLAEAAPAGGDEVASTATAATSEEDSFELVGWEKTLAFWGVILTVLIVLWLVRLTQRTKSRMEEMGVHAAPHSIDNYIMIFGVILLIFGRGFLHTVKLTRK